MLLSSITEENDFNTTRALNILSDKNKRNSLINKIIHIMNIKRYKGADIDFEYIENSQKETYISFLRELSVKLKENNCFLSVILAHKTSDNQESLLCEAHDYSLIGKIADMVFLMTYE